MIAHGILALVLAIAIVGCDKAPGLADENTPEGPGPIIGLPEARIAFTVRYPTPDSMPLYTVRPDGSDLKKIVSGFGLRMGPAWSPDRTNIAFSYQANSRSEIRVIRADGTDERTVLSAPGHAIYTAPEWSPDGDRLIVRERMPDGTARLVMVGLSTDTTWAAATNSQAKSAY